MMAGLKQMKKIDSHIHFWSLARGDYAWLTPELYSLYRDFLPIDVVQQRKEHNVEKVIVVQAAPTIEETEYLLSLSDTESSIAGIVGWVDLDHENSLEQLRTFSINKKFVGIRPMLPDYEDIRWILSDSFTPIFDLLITHNLCFDALILPKHLPSIIELAKKFPQLNIVIDHAAKPDISSNELKPWLDLIKRLSFQNNCYCKLSGLLCELNTEQTKVNLQLCMQHVFNCFGSERLMWGSDWPVVNLAGDYDEWLEISNSLISQYSLVSQENIWSKTAEKFYNLTT